MADCEFNWLQSAVPLGAAAIAATVAILVSNQHPGSGRVGKQAALGRWIEG